MALGIISRVDFPPSGSFYHRRFLAAPIRSQGEFSSVTPLFRRIIICTRRARREPLVREPRQRSSRSCSRCCLEKSNGCIAGLEPRDDFYDEKRSLTFPRIVVNVTRRAHFVRERTTDLNRTVTLKRDDCGIMSAINVDKKVNLGARMGWGYIECFRTRGFYFRKYWARNDDKSLMHKRSTNFDEFLYDDGTSHSWHYFGKISRSISQRFLRNNISNSVISK